MFGGNHKKDLVKILLIFSWSGLLVANEINEVEKNERVEKIEIDGRIIYLFEGSAQEKRKDVKNFDCNTDPKALLGYYVHNLPYQYLSTSGIVVSKDLYLGLWHVCKKKLVLLTKPIDGVGEKIIDVAGIGELKNEAFRFSCRHRAEKKKLKEDPAIFGVIGDQKPKQNWVIAKRGWGVINKKITKLNQVECMYDGMAE